SYAWGPLFIRDLLAAPELAGSTVVLHDIDSGAMDLVYRVGQLAIKVGDYDFQLRQTGDLGEALSDADFVILTITTGGLEAMRHDLEIPTRYDIHQSVGDTVGPGGLSRGLRNIPVVVEIARQMENHCPDAWLLNYSNPLTTLTRAVNRESSIKSIGLCHEWLGVRHKLSLLFDAPEGDFQPRIAGINHLIWLLDLWLDGRCLMPDLRDMASKVLSGELDLDPDDQSLFADHGRVKARLLHLFGALPVAGDRHLAEFFPNFLNNATSYGQTYGVTLTSVGDRYGWRAADKAHLERILDGEVDIRPFLDNQSNEAAHSIISALATNRHYTGIMNLPNRGQISNLPHDVVVETYGIVNSSGAHGISAGDLPPAIHAIVNRHVSNQELIVEAALTGDRKLALQALLNDPLITLAPEDVTVMLDELIEANREYLPLFYQ
ncbi:MAG: hypothetical protein JSV68_20410, partial [Anaerolineaceae bacterium]